jgi:regulator of sigma E protease
MPLVYIFGAVLVLLFMITVHEFGHYLAAKLLKFRVNEFAIGFGKPLFKHVNKKNGEVFSLRLVPLGGFCAFETNDPTDAPGAVKQEKIPGVDYTPFEKMAAWKRLIVLFSGAFFNFICGVIFCGILLMAIGYQQTVEIGPLHPNSHLIEVFEDNGIVSYEVDARGNKVAGTNGDTILRVNGEKMSLFNNWDKLISPYGVSTTSIAENVDADKIIHLTIRRQSTGEIIQVDVFKSIFAGETTGETVRGLGLNGRITFIKMSFVSAVPHSFALGWEIIALVMSALFKMMTFQIALSQMGGTFSTIAIMSSAMSTNMLNLLLLVPLISINLAIFNLLPVPALDGARMVFVLIEWIRGKPINPAIEGRIHMIGILCLLGFVILLDFNYLILQRLF